MPKKRLPRRGPTRSGVRLPVIAAVVVLVTGCGVQIPVDPDGTLERVQGGVLRVGVTEHPPWVDLGGMAPTGIEPGLVEGFAERHGAEIEWTPGSEAALADALERGEIDLAIGGYLDDTPWASHAAVTRAYAETATADGSERHVMLVRMGENAFQVALEEFLHEEAGP